MLAEMPRKETPKKEYRVVPSIARALNGVFAFTGNEPAKNMAASLQFLELWI